MVRVPGLFRRWITWVGCAAVCLSLACGSDAGCGGDYEYPRTDADAIPTPQALRMRITEQGLQAIADGLPAIIAAGCADPTSDSCAPDPSNPDRVNFFLGSPDNPVELSSSPSVILRPRGRYAYSPEFDSTWDGSSAIEQRLYCDDTGGTACDAVRQRGVGNTGNGFCRLPGSSGCTYPANDYCCGQAAPHLCSGTETIPPCDAEGSSFGLDLASLAGHLHLGLVQDPQGGGIQVTIGCVDPSNCDPADWVRGFLDLVTVIDPGLGIDDYACFIQNDVDGVGQTAGFDLRSFRFTVKPRIELGADGKPYLQVTDSDVTVETFDMALYLSSGPAFRDPACYDEGWTGSLCAAWPWFQCAEPSGDQFSDCTGLLACGAINFLTAVVEPLLESEYFGSLIAAQLARTMFEQFSKDAMETVGVLDFSELLPVGSRHAKPVGYLIPANTASPDVTGSTGALGLNFDFDAGFAGEHSACVPLISCPVGPGGTCWELPPVPDPGVTVDAPDPVTGILTPESFDLAFLVGDAMVERAVFEMFDGGGFCLDLGAEALGELTGGAFMPNLGALSILAPGLANLGPAETPVDIRMRPKLAPRVFFGTGAGEGETRDSHIQLIWPSVEIEMYPLIDDAHLRVIAFSFDLDLGLSLDPTPTGNMELMLDRILLTNVGQTYNEFLGSFDAQGFADLVELFLPMLLSGDPIAVDLTAAALGIPFVPKVRAVEARGPGKDFLALFMRFCTGDQILNPTDALCYEDPSGSGSAAEPALAVARLEGPGGAQLPPTEMRLRVFSDIAVEGDLQLAFRVDDVGPWLSFRTVADDGTLLVHHPMLAVPGLHRLSFIARDRTRPGRWSHTVDLVVLSDHSPPVLHAARVAGGIDGIDGIEIIVDDDVTPVERIAVRVEIVASDRADSLDFAPRGFVAAPDTARVTLWARDEAGNVSAPRVVAGRPSRSLPEEPAPEGEGGCAAAGTPLAALLGLALFRRRRRSRQLSTNRR
ncbi:MAG: hypothetical protein V3T05_01570 [Myxococcota bacterium]